ncbi:DUF2231 domain-containing protein [Nitrincola alkalilacustris]|uniref:DUF2231 domain-containing protein n=1 Tax=Nitrincola alkalilacustris TaxID=1571224 RepID=UPI00124C2B64|nr:DUF2231 domain-containing protein [Nitrincola alkalilacustris]
MTGMHHMLVHFPLAFWALATLMILIASLTHGYWADISRKALLPLLILSLLGAVAAIISGLLVWPLEANTHSPMTRNHILTSYWSAAIYALLTLLIWRGGASAFSGCKRWVLVILALIGSVLFAISGTLGGHLAGAPTHFSTLLGLLGWNVYSTLYVPDWTLIAILLIGISCLLVGWKTKQQ